MGKKRQLYVASDKGSWLSVNLGNDPAWVLETIQPMPLRHQYLSLYKILVVAKFNPPAKWLNSKLHYPIQYFENITGFLSQVERRAREVSSALTKQGETHDDRKLNKMFEWLSVGRLQQVFEMSKDDVVLDVLINKPGVFNQFFSVLENDFFKSQIRHPYVAADFVSLMKSMIARLAGKQPICGFYLESLYLIFQAWVNYRTNAEEACHHEAMQKLFDRVLSWFDAAQMILPLTADKMKADLARLVQGFHVKGVATHAPSNAVPAQTLLLLSGEAGEEPAAASYQSPKRVKLMAQPAVFFLPHKIPAPLSDCHDKAGLKF